MRLTDLLARLNQPIPYKGRQDDYFCFCPCHADGVTSGRRSLRVQEKDGKILMYCFAGCQTKDIVRALGLSMSDLFIDKPKTAGGKQVEAIYDFRSADGKLVYQVIRYIPKFFNQRRPDGRGGWIWNLQGITPLPYKLPELLAALEAGETVYIAEGEKDVDNLTRIGLPATSNSGGAGKWRQVHSNYFPAGANVVILQDNDESGRDHAKKVKEQLAARGCNVKILNLPGLPEKGDIVNWLTSGGTREKLLELVDELIEPKQPKTCNAESTDLRPEDYSDVGQANTLIKMYGQILRYSKATKWLYYTGAVWDEDDIKAQSLVQMLTQKQLEEARAELKKAREAMDRAVETEDEDAKTEARLHEARAKEYRSFVLSRRKSSNISAALTEARPTLAIDIKSLDADPFLLNTPGGTVNLRTGNTRPHTVTDFITKITAVSPGDVGVELFKEFLQVITCKDKDLESYLQLVAGMAAVGKVFSEVLIIAYGAGRNGKSTFFNLLARVLGDYYCGMSSEFLTINARQNKRPEFAELRGRRLVIAGELEEGRRLDTAILKKLCSTDPIAAEKKYKDPFTFVPSHTIVLYTNHLPRVGTSDTGTWRRLIVIPFNAIIEGDDDIKNYSDHLFQHAGGAVLSWLIEGAQRFIAAGYKLVAPPDCVAQAIGKYRDANDWLGHFLAERCERLPHYRERSGELYAAYRSYCQATGEYTRSSADFKAALVAAGFETRKTKHGSFVFGVQLQPDFEKWDPQAAEG